MATTTENYLMDLGKEVLALAQNAQQGPSGDAFQTGRRTAFHEVLSLMRQQAHAFELGDDAVGLEGVDLEQLLFCPPRLSGSAPKRPFTTSGGA